MRRSPFLIALILVCATPVHAAESPQLINYQGVLRDSSGNPENGSFDMVFRFFDQDGDPTCSGGTLLLTDSHQAAGSGAVSVINGLFNTALGGGVITQGSVATLADTFRATPEVYLEVEVATETLCPRTRVLSSAYSVNAAREAPAGDMELFVDGAAGDDGNDGLTSSTPKLTIMGAVRAMPAVLNGHVTILIAPGTYQEEVILSGRQRNGPYIVLLQQNTASPDTDSPSVVIEPPAAPCTDCLNIGITTTDELVRIVGLQVDGFRFMDGSDFVGDGILASGSTNLTMANVIVSNNYTGISSTDGHFVELEADCVVRDNDIGLLSFDHGSIEVNAPVTFCNNSPLSLRSERNSWIRIEGDAVSCTFCVGDGPLRVFSHSSIESSPCANQPACGIDTPGAGLCPGDFP